MGLCSNRSLTFLLCLAGLGLSGYSYYEEMKMKADPEYKPLCDINEDISCSKAFNSTWGKGFGLVKYVVEEDHWLNQPNPIYGFFTYTLLAFFGLLNVRFIAKLQLYISVLLNFGSVYLGYVLHIVLKTLCVVCISVYAVNFLILVASFLKVRRLGKSAGERGGQQQKKQQQADKRSKQNFSLPTTSNPMDFKKNL